MARGAGEERWEERGGGQGRRRGAEAVPGPGQVRARGGGLRSGAGAAGMLCGHAPPPRPAPRCVCRSDTNADGWVGG